MPTREKALEFAIEVDKEYPATLAERLEWWSRLLQIKRPRLLRMIGMTEQAADRLKGKTLDVILKTEPWNENGWLLEGNLHELLKTFDYDKRGLVEWLHRTGNGAENEAGRRSLQNGAKVHLTANGSKPASLIDELEKGGQPALSRLIASLNESAIP